MASTSAAPSGFSYAQAARGQKTGLMATTQASPETPGTGAAGDWADDVEAHTKSRGKDTAVQEKVNTGLDRTKADAKVVQSSGIPSPDIAASTTSHDDASSTAQAGTSMSSWEAKSQSSDTVLSPSEPAWIAERKERQNVQKTEPSTSKAAPTASGPEQKPVVLHEAAPPAVNPWAKRAEEAKTKIVPQPAASTKVAQSSEPARAASTPDAKSIPQRPAPAQPSKSDGPVARAEPVKGHRASKSVVAQPPSVRDQQSWPTPESTQELEKRNSTSQPVHEDRSDEDATSNKPRKKQEWKPVAVVPNIIWETPGIHSRPPRTSPNGERSSRGGASARGRGGARGGASTHADRTTTHNTEADSTVDASLSVREASNSRDVEADSKHAKAARKSGFTNGIKTELAADKDASTDSASTVTAQESELKVNTDNEFFPAALANSTPSIAESSDITTPIERKDSVKEWPNPRGGARRGGRGRGGNRDLVNGHNAYVNGHNQDYNPSFVSSPTFTRGGYGYGRAGMRQNGNRAQSLPFDPSLYQFRGYLPHPMYGQMMAYPAPMADYNSFALSQQQFDDYNRLILTVSKQLEYYFSVDNLLKDTYLRKNMDSQGFVLLEVIAAFNRLKQLTTSLDVLKTASANSDIIEIVLGDDGKERLRQARGWDQWVLPSEERFVAARTAGPQQFESLRHYYQSQPVRHPSMPFLNAQRPGDRRSYDFSYGMQMSPQAMYSPDHLGSPHTKEAGNGFDEGRGRHAKTPAQDSEPSADTQLASPSVASEDADVFPNDKIEQLTVCVMLSKEAAPQYNASSRTFSNGSIDAKVVDNEAPNVAGKVDSTPVIANGESHSDSTSDSQDLSVFWIKDNDSPASSLPSNLTPEPYFRLRAKALEQRSSASTGNCPYDMEVLYQFWSHFLIRNFNNSMYSEFVHYAHDDNLKRYSSVGHRNLANYYDQAINSGNLIPLRVAKDYMSLAKAESSKEGSMVFKNLHRAWRNGALNIRNRKRFSDILDPELKEKIET